MSIKLIKLVTGEELLADIIDGNNALNEVISLKNPVRIVVMPNKIDPKTPNIGFAPWAEFSEDKTIDIDKSHIIATMTPIKEFVTQYNTMFGGLVVPKSNLILPGN